MEILYRNRPRYSMSFFLLQQKVPLVAPVLSPRISEDPYVDAVLLSIAHKCHLVVDGRGTTASFVGDATAPVRLESRRDVSGAAHRDAARYELHYRISRPWVGPDRTVFIINLD